VKVLLKTGYKTFYYLMKRCYFWIQSSLQATA